MNYPHFKYHPNAYILNIFEKEDGICSICHEKRELKYNCSFYSIDTPDYICPWCIENGAAAKLYQGSFNDDIGIENTEFIDDDEIVNVLYPITDEFVGQICHRTPSYASWQQQVWLIHCDEPCQFINYATSKLLQPILHEVLEDIENSNIPLEWIQHHLTIDSDFSAYLFQCIHCGKHRLHLDSC